MDEAFDSAQVRYDQRLEAALAAAQARIAALERERDALAAAIERHCRAFETSSLPGSGMIVADLRAALAAASSTSQGDEVE
jgi:hypothetical protein